MPAFLLAAAALAFKAPDSLTHPQLWAEDGPTFFAEQRATGLPLVFVPYASYLHFVPRAVAWIASLLPIAHVPAAYCYSAWLLGSAALSSLRWVALGRVPFIVLLAGVALTPTNGEVFGTLTNVQWLFQFQLLAVIASFVSGERDERPWRQALLTFGIGLSGPFALFACAACLGLMALSRVSLPGLARQPLRPTLELYALGAASAGQIACVILSGSDANLSEDPLTWLASVRVVSLIQLHALTQEPLPRWLFRLWLAAACVLTLRCLEDRVSRLTLLGIYGFTLLQVAAVIRKFSGASSFALATMENADRYFVMPKAVLFWQLAILLAAVAGRRPLLRPALLTALMLGPVFFYGGWLQRPPFPDHRWRDHAARVEQGQAVDVDISPPGWQVHVEPR